MEHKTFSSFATKVDSDLGIVEHLIAVMGNTDLGGDVIHLGAFKKTLNERGHKVKVLDLHKTDSVMRVIGKPLELREIGLAELPAQVKEQYPSANGALLARTQFLIDTPEGLGAFKRIKVGAVDEYSFGYDAISPDFTKDDNGNTIRNLREVRLYEYGPVIFGMNPAPATLSAKATEPEPSEAKPWKVFFEDGKYCVYKVNEDGDKVGSPLGKHETEEDANAQIRALHANVREKGIEPSEGKPVESTGDYVRIRIKDPGDFQEGTFRTIDISKGEGIRAIIGKLKGETSTTVQVYLFDKEKWTEERARKWVEEHKKDALPDIDLKAGRRMRADMVEMLKQVLAWASYEDESDEQTAPADEQAALTAKTTEAGPQTAPTSEVTRQRLLLFADTLEV